MASPFQIQRLTLTAAQETAIIPPRPFHTVLIANATADDVKVYTESGADTTNYRVISAGYELDLPIRTTGASFDPQIVNFYLKATATGTVILTWA